MEKLLLIAVIAAFIPTIFVLLARFNGGHWFTTMIFKLCGWVYLTVCILIILKYFNLI